MAIQIIPEELLVCHFLLSDGPDQVPRLIITLVLEHIPSLLLPAVDITPTLMEFWPLHPQQLLLVHQDNQKHLIFHLWQKAVLCQEHALHLPMEPFAPLIQLLLLHLLALILK